MERYWNSDGDEARVGDLASRYTGGYTGCYNLPFEAREAAYLDRIEWSWNTPDFLGDDHPRDIGEAEAVEIYDPNGDVAEVLRAAAPAPKTGEGGTAPEPPSTYEELVNTYGHTNPFDRWGVAFCDRLGSEAAWALFDLETWALKAQTFNEHVLSEIDRAARS